MENKDVLDSKSKVKKKNILQKDLSLKEVLVVIGGFAIIAGYVGLFILPKYNEFQNLLTQLNDVNQEIVDYKSEISTIPRLEKRLSSLNNEVDIEKSKLSYNMEDGMFLIGLSNLINKLGVNLISYTMDETISYNSFYAIPTTIEVRGNYNNIRKIMNYLEEQKNITQILDYSMETYIDEEKNNQTGVNQIEDNQVENNQVEDNQTENVQAQNNQTEDNQIENNQVEEKSEPKATGDVVAKFKFVMYSTEEPSAGLNNDDTSIWKSGKYNPFTSTTR